jgi:tRNA A-37 threonylcarbamoyl transferase component Bud32
MRQIGQGAMGTVFEARHLLIGRRTAIKVLAESLLTNPEFVARFLNEARAANRVRHPGLLEVYECGNLPAGEPYLIMELLEGESLEHRLVRNLEGLPRPVVLEVARQIASALDVAHQHGITHRDLKPANVMLVRDPEAPDRDRVKILDFGIAKLAATESFSAVDGHSTGAGLILGTPGYMAPEQCLCSGRIDGQADVYALGVMIYEMCCGKRPFVALTPIEVMGMHVRDTPPPLDANQTAPELIMLVNQMLAKHPSQRPTMVEVAGELGRLLGLPAVERSASVRNPAGRAAPEIVPATAPTLIGEDSPFIVGPPITYPRRFFGRQRVLRRIAGLWRHRPMQNAAVLGSRRSGKTSLLLHLKDYVRGLPGEWWPDGQALRFSYLDFQDPRLASREGVFRHLLRDLGIAAGESVSTEQFIESVATHLRSPTVILMDELDVALSRYQELDDSFWEGLRALATNQVDGKLAFVLGCHEAPAEVAHRSQHGSPFFNIFGYTATLGPFRDDEAEALMDSSPLPFPAADRAFMLEKSGRWPILLQILCRERYLSLQENDPSSDWQEEASRQMEPFRHLLKG